MLVSEQLELLKASLRTGMAGRWELTDEQWELVEPILRPARREDNRGRPWHDTRAVLNGVLWVLGCGAQWAEMPAKYQPYLSKALRLPSTGLWKLFYPDVSSTSCQKG